jgi:hypothetical protein
MENRDTYTLFFFTSRAIRYIGAGEVKGTGPHLGTRTPARFLVDLSVGSRIYGQFAKFSPISSWTVPDTLKIT